MMTGGVLVLEAVVPFAAISNLGLDSTPLSIVLSGRPGEEADALLRLDRQPASETDVIGATGELDENGARALALGAQRAARRRCGRGLPDVADRAPSVRAVPVRRAVVRRRSDGHGRVSRRHERRSAGSLAASAVLFAFAVFFVVPLAWLVLAPTKTDDDLLTRSPLAVGDLHNVLVAWRNLNTFGGHIYRRWMENSLLYSLSATAIALAVALPAGYGLAVGRFRGRRLVLSLTLIAMLIPASSLVLPIYLELNAMRLIGNAFSIILPFAFFPFGVFLAYMYYATALPPGLLDAARIDGCNELQAFVRVALPLAKPVAALIFFFSFVADWNNFFLPYAILPDQTQFPVQVGLTDIFRSSRPTVALATLIAALPVAIVFVVSQRALVRGATMGATSG